MSAPSQSPAGESLREALAQCREHDLAYAELYVDDAVASLAEIDRLTAEIEKLREAAFDAYYLLMNIEAVLPDDIESVLAMLRAALPRPAP